MQTVLQKKIVLAFLWYRSVCGIPIVLHNVHVFLLPIWITQNQVGPTPFEMFGICQSGTKCGDPRHNTTRALPTLPRHVASKVWHAKTVNVFELISIYHSSLTHTRTHIFLQTYIHYITLHYITWHHTSSYITLHYITLIYTTLNHITLNYINVHITLNYINFHYITLHVLKNTYVFIYIYKYTSIHT